VVALVVVVVVVGKGLFDQGAYKAESHVWKDRMELNDLYPSTGGLRLLLCFTFLL
jgi:hypothetical protein